MKDYLWSVLLFGLSGDRQQLGTGVHQTNSRGCLFLLPKFFFFRYSSRSTFLSISVSRTQTQLTGRRVLISATSQVQVRSVWAACACPHWLSPPSTAWCYAYVLRPPSPPHCIHESEVQVEEINNVECQTSMPDTDVEFVITGSTGAV